MCHAGPTYSRISRQILRLVSVSYTSPYPDTSGCMQPACLHNFHTFVPLDLCPLSGHSCSPTSGPQTSTPLDACSKPTYIMSRPPDLIHTHSWLICLPLIHLPLIRLLLICLPLVHLPSIQDSYNTPNPEISTQPHLDTPLFSAIRLYTCLLHMFLPLVISIPVSAYWSL